LLQIACDFLQATWSFSNWCIGHLVESCLTGHWCQDRCFDVLVLKNHSLHHLKQSPIMLVFSILDKKCWGHCPNAWFILTSINIPSFLDTLLALRHVLIFPAGFVSVLQCMHSWPESSFYFSHWADQPFLSLAPAMCKKECVQIAGYPSDFAFSVSLSMHLSVC
jgi:hypothetical protein